MSTRRPNPCTLTLRRTDCFQLPPHGTANPIDANVSFHCIALGTTVPAATFEALGAAPPGMIHAIHPWSVRSP